MIYISKSKAIVAENNLGKNKKSTSKIWLNGYNFVVMSYLVLCRILGKLIRKIKTSHFHTYLSMQ